MEEAIALATDSASDTVTGTDQKITTEEVATSETRETVTVPDTGAGFAAAADPTPSPDTSPSVSESFFHSSGHGSDSSSSDSGSSYGSSSYDSGSSYSSYDSGSSSFDSGSSSFCTASLTADEARGRSRIFAKLAL